MSKIICIQGVRILSDKIITYYRDDDRQETFITTIFGYVIRFDDEIGDVQELLDMELGYCE